MSVEMNISNLYGFDVTPYLDSKDGGERLAAYAYLYAKPDPKIFGKLVGSVKTTISDRYERFAQYWGLQATSKNLLQEGAKALSDDMKESLRSCAKKVEPNTDRDYLLRTIVSQI